MTRLNLTRTLILTLVVLSGCGSEQQPATNQEVFLFLPDGGSPGFRRDMADEAQTLIGERCAENDVVHFISTPNHATLATVVVPAGSRNKRLRSSDVRSELQGLAEYFKAETAEGSLQVELPSMAATIRSQRRTTFPVRVIIAGTPVYQNESHAGWSMAGGMVPTDASLASPMSPFSGGVVDFPAGTKVAWMTPDAGFGEDRAHEEAVTRFYRLFFEKHSATLTHVTADVKTAMHGQGTQFSDTLTPLDDGVGVRLAALRSSKPQRVVANKPVVEVAVIEAPIEADREPTAAVEVPEAPRQEAEQVLAAAEQTGDTIALAINWVSADPRCDIDMRIRSAGDSQELFYDKKQTAFGELYRDVRHSGSIDGEGADYQNWEWASIDHDRRNDLTLWLNAFSTTKPATVRVICVWKGRRHEQTVQLSGTGDAGKSFIRNLSSAWAKVDLQRMPVHE